MPSQLPVNIAGESMLALADKALYWERERTLFVADVHFGKAASFRAHAVAVPSGTTIHDLERLSALVALTGCQNITILGDMWHARQGLVDETVRVIREWRTANAGFEMRLVRGNHDRKCGALPAGLDIEEVDEPFSCDPFTLVHDPKSAEGKYSLGGHIHPCVRLEGKGRQSTYLPCFTFGREVGILPGFGSFTGCGQVHPNSEDQVLVLADGNVIEVQTPAVAHL